MNLESKEGRPSSLTVCAQDLNDVLEEIYTLVMFQGRETAPRGKPVLEWPGPVVIDLQQTHPWTLIPGRRLNPYFAVAEVIWILAGRGDVEFIAYYNKNIATFSDDGVKFHGAYGDRMRSFPEYVFSEEIEAHYLDHIDQIQMVVERLRQDHFSRQAVICLWDPARDLKAGSKDYPCNNLCYFTLRRGALDMSVVRRSNDMVWGLPYNQIQFYFLKALVAGSLGAEMGRYYEFVQNMHVYTEQYPELFGLIKSRLDKWVADANAPLTTTIEGLDLDRRITFEQFDMFSKMFFAAERNWRRSPDTLTLEDVQVVGLSMLSAGVPKYWIDNMLVLPAAYIARKGQRLELWERLVSELEPGLQWLVRDFHTKAENKVER